MILEELLDSNLKESQAGPVGKCLEMLRDTLRKLSGIRSHVEQQGAQPLEIAALKQLDGQAIEAAYSSAKKIERAQAYYHLPESLRVLVRAATVLSRPLLLEGEPGTGKTALGYKLIELLCADDVIHARCNQEQSPSSFMYEIDHVARLSAALGQSVPDTFRPQLTTWVERLKQGADPNSREFREFMEGFSRVVKAHTMQDALNIRNYVKFGDFGSAIERAARGEKVILIVDEIDKATDEFIDGFLDQLEHLTIRIAETGEEIVAPTENIFILVTSNGKKELSDAFLRRCLFGELEFPNEQMMADIIRHKVPGISNALLQSAIKQFYKVRELPLEKKPSTSEAIDWMRILFENGIEVVDTALPYHQILIKNKRDIQQLLEHGVITNEKSRQIPLPAEYAAADAGKLVIKVFDGTTRMQNLMMVLANHGIAFDLPIGSERAVGQYRPFKIHDAGIEMIDGRTFAITNYLSEEECKMESVAEIQAWRSMHGKKKIPNLVAHSEFRWKRLIEEIFHLRCIEEIIYPIDALEINFTSVKEGNECYTIGSLSSGDELLRRPDKSWLFKLKNIDTWNQITMTFPGSNGEDTDSHEAVARDEYGDLDELIEEGDLLGSGTLARIRERGVDNQSSAVLSD